MISFTEMKTTSPPVLNPTTTPLSGPPSVSTFTTMSTTTLMSKCVVPTLKLICVTDRVPLSHSKVLFIKNHNTRTFRIGE